MILVEICKYPCKLPGLMLYLAVQGHYRCLYARKNIDIGGIDTRQVW